MKRKRFSVEQIVAILKQVEMGMPVAELIGRVGISEQTFYRWKKQFDAILAARVRPFVSRCSRTSSAPGQLGSVCVETRRSRTRSRRYDQIAAPELVWQ